MKIIRSIVIGIAMVSFAGCTNMSHKQQGTLSGAAIGAAAGAGIAAIAGGSGWTGAAIGGVAGGIAGNIYGGWRAVDPGADIAGTPAMSGALSHCHQTVI
jgi:hypothetical protein